MKNMAARTGTLTWKKGWLIFTLCWIGAFFTVTLLRQALIPREEMDCYERLGTLQNAVDRWNKSHPDKKITDEIDEQALEKEGLWKAGGYDPKRHYYFIGETPHGPSVKCNKDEDNPLLLRLTGVTLLAILVFMGVCYSRGLVLFRRD